MPPASAVPILSIPGASGSNGLTASPLQSGMPGNGLFLGFLSQIGLNTGNIGVENTHPQFGRAAFNTDPAMLVLPPGVTTLSGSDLRAYLATQAKESGLSDSILTAMTAGIPQVTASDDVLNGDISLLPTDIIKDIAWGYDDPIVGNIDTETAENIFDMGGCLAPEHTLESYDTSLFFNDGELDVSCYLPDGNLEAVEDNPASSNPLLIATGLTPAQIEDFQQQLIAQSDIESKNKEDADKDVAAMAMVLVNFAAPAPDDKTSPPDVHMNEIGDATSKHNMLRPLHPFEVQKLAENMNDAGTKEESGYIAGFARHNSFTNGVANNHAAATQSQGNTAAGSMDDVSQFFLAAAPSSDTYGLLSPLSAQNPLAPNNTASSPILYNNNAASAHPATQMVAATLTKAAGKTDKEQTLSLELDPPELGRVQIHLSYEKGEPLKVRVLTEKQETLTLLQRDAHALKSALDDAGIKADGSSLSFDMAGSDQSFNQMLGQFHDQQGHRSASRFSLADTRDEGMGAGLTVTIETHLADVPSFGGNGQGYSFLA